MPADKKGPAVNIMHYAMGVGSGGLYGALAEVDPVLPAGCGVVFRAALWARRGLKAYFNSSFRVAFASARNSS